MDELDAYMTRSIGSPRHASSRICVASMLFVE
jgi:hypothetical protein